MLQNHDAKVAIYARRSPEDKHNRTNLFRGDGVTDSIESQLLMLHQYADGQGFVNCQEYYDDNISGTTFIRKDFTRMLDDIRSGLVDTVIVKDLSRLGRDYIESGRYQEVVFPELGTRLIAVLDNYDSATGAGTDTAPFKNLFNDWYVKDISGKTKAALHARAASGKYLSSGIYGYRKDPQDKNKLIPDPNTAPVVQRIFYMVAGGYSFRLIARTLSNEGVLTPSAVKDMAPRTSVTRSVDWNTSTISAIIRNPEYLGKVVYGRSRKVSYKSKKVVDVPEEQHIVIEGTHEPLVSQELWDLANDVAKRHRKCNSAGEIHIFSGLLRCADCQSSMTASASDTYICQRYRTYSKTENGCTSHRIPHDLLYSAVLVSVQEVTQAARQDRDGLIARLSGISQRKQQAALNAARKEQARAEKRLADIGQLIRKAFEQNALGTMQDDVYTGLIDGYTQERSELSARLESLKAQIKDLTEDTDNAEQFVSLAEQYVDVTELDRDLVHRLIEHIEISESHKENGVRYQTVDIYFRFVGKVSF
jgi:DNA invertase Pin-like site-specific DNA recombinase